MSHFLQKQVNFHDRRFPSSASAPSLTNSGDADGDVEGVFSPMVESTSSDSAIVSPTAPHCGPPDSNSPVVPQGVWTATLYDDPRDMRILATMLTVMFTLGLLYATHTRRLQHIYMTCECDICTLQTNSTDGRVRVYTLQSVSTGIIRRSTVLFESSPRFSAAMLDEANTKAEGAIPMYSFEWSQLLFVSYHKCLQHFAFSGYEDTSNAPIRAFIRSLFNHSMAKTHGVIFLAEENGEIIAGIRDNLKKKNNNTLLHCIADPTGFFRSRIYYEHSKLDPVQYLTLPSWPQPLKKILRHVCERFSISSMTPVSNFLFRVTKPIFCCKTHLFNYTTVWVQHF